MPEAGGLLWTCGGVAVRLAGAPEAPGLRHLLAGRLLAKFAPDGFAPGISGGADSPADFRLEHDSLGRPQALSAQGAPLGVGLSFSRHGGWLWAAAAAHAGLGVDAAGAEDFSGDYPDAKAFGAEELAAARRLSASLEQARALLWSLKEAAAKAAGTGLRTAFTAYAASGLRREGAQFCCTMTTPLGPAYARAEVIGGVHIAVAVHGPAAKENP